jgi:hypothetical protein
MPRRRKGSRPSAFMASIRTATKAFLMRPARNRCQLCGYRSYVGNLSFHHRNPTTKSFNISTMIHVCSLPKLVAEASKCLLVCHNCHGEIHAGLINSNELDKIPTLSYQRYRVPKDIIKWYYKRAING